MIEGNIDGGDIHWISVSNEKNPTKVWDIRQGSSDGSRVGRLILSQIDPETLYIRDLDIDPEARGYRNPAILIRFIQQQARKVGATKITWNSGSDSVERISPKVATSVEQQNHVSSASVYAVAVEEFSPEHLLGLLRTAVRERGSGNHE